MRDVTIRKRVVKTFEWSCSCLRCAHEWVTLGDVAPTRCPKCKSRRFAEPPRWKRPDLRKKPRNTE